MKLLKNYQNALDAIYKHVGFEEDYVVCPIDDKTDCFWYTDGEIVKYAETLEDMNSNGNYYLDDIYTQRFYEKWIYEGEDLTMVFCDPHIDGMKWWRIFDNKKKIKL